MKTWIWILSGIAALYALGYALTQAAGATVCVGDNPGAATMALPDRVFWGVWLWIVPLAQISEDRGHWMSLQPEDVPIFRHAMQDLVDMGLVHWAGESERGAALEFYVPLVVRLADRADLMEPFNARRARLREIHPRYGPPRAATDDDQRSTRA